MLDNTQFNRMYVFHLHPSSPKKYTGFDEVSLIHMKSKETSWEALR